MIIYTYGILFIHRRVKTWANGMAQWIKAPVSKPDGPSLIPWAHMVEGKSQFLQIVPNLHVCTVRYI